MLLINSSIGYELRWLVGIELYDYFLIMKKLVIKFSDLVCEI